MATSKKAPSKKRAPAAPKATVAKTAAALKKPAARKKTSKASVAFERDKRLTLLLAIFTALSLVFASLVFHWYA
jgi:hypothetical protein